jgi:hypothetical protein
MFVELSQWHILSTSQRDEPRVKALGAIQIIESVISIDSAAIVGAELRRCEGSFMPGLA